MGNSVVKDIPVVAVCNISEAFFDFLNRAEDPEARIHLIQGEQFRGDRTLVWIGDPKLVFVTFPIPHADYLCQRFGYPGTHYMAPSDPSPWLCLDILREAPLMDRLLEYVGPRRTVQLIPYATTRQFLQLVDTLRGDYGLTVLLPESPAPESLWLRDYIDSKAGFRMLASRWLPDSASLLLDGVACQDKRQAAAVVHWFALQGLSCVVKADDGENGIGNFIVQPGDFPSEEAILRRLETFSFLNGNVITVEQYLPSSRPISPSLEVYVPPLGKGDPYITYVSDQVFLNHFGDFCGVLVSRELLEKKWYPPLAENGLLIARNLQQRGYAGHFDLDAIVDDEDHIFLLEVNSRRTGGTHVHEFARHVFGPNYLDEVVLLSHDAMKSEAVTYFDELLDVIGDLLYPMAQERKGVVVTITSALLAGEFGCIIVASSTSEAIAIQQALMERIHGIAERSGL